MESRKHPRTVAQHKFLSKPPKRLAVVDQSCCSGCAGAPACQSYCETVEFKKKVVNAIRTVPSPEGPFELSVVEFDKCIGCGLCAGICPWGAITVYPYDEALKIAPLLTMAPHEAVADEASVTEHPAAEL